jgi:hypothetical protein
VIGFVLGLLAWAIVWTIIGYEFGRHRHDVASERQFKLVSKRSGELCDDLRRLQNDYNALEREYLHQIEGD